MVHGKDWYLSRISNGKLLSLFNNVPKSQYDCGEMRLGVVLVRVTVRSKYRIDNGLHEGILSLFNNVPKSPSQKTNVNLD